MTVSVRSPDLTLTSRLRQIAADRITHALGDIGQARVVLTSGGFEGSVHACVTVALAGRTVEVEGAAGAAEYAMVNAALALRQLDGSPVPQTIGQTACPDQPSTP